MIEPIPNQPIETLLQKLATDMAQVGRTMPTAELRKEMTRLAGSLEACTANLAASAQQAKETVATKREQNKAKAASNQAAIKQARAKLATAEQTPAEPVAEVPVDPTLGGQLRDQLLARITTATPAKPAATTAEFVLENW